MSGLITKNELNKDLNDLIDSLDVQTPTIIGGNQIRLKGSTLTRKYGFELNSTLTGTLTVSIDNGTTILPLREGDKVTQVTTLEPGYYEVIANAGFFTLNSSGPKAAGTAVEGEVLEGKTFSNDVGIELVGSMPNIGSIGTQNITTHNGEYIIPRGFHNGLGKVKAVISGLAASIIRAGSNVGGVLGTYTADANAVAGNILSGKTAYVNGSKITGSLIPPQIVKGSTTLSKSSQETIITHRVNLSFAPTTAIVSLQYSTGSLWKHLGMQSTDGSSLYVPTGTYSYYLGATYYYGQGVTITLGPNYIDISASTATPSTSVTINWIIYNS